MSGAVLDSAAHRRVLTTRPKKRVRPIRVLGRGDFTFVPGTSAEACRLSRSSVLVSVPAESIYRSLTGRIPLLIFITCPLLIYGTTGSAKFFKASN